MCGVSVVVVTGYPKICLVYGAFARHAATACCQGEGFVECGRGNGDDIAVHGAAGGLYVDNLEVTLHTAGGMYVAKFDQVAHLLCRAVEFERHAQVLAGHVVVELVEHQVWRLGAYGQGQGVADAVEGVGDGDAKRAHWVVGICRDVGQDAREVDYSHFIGLLPQADCTETEFYNLGIAVVEQLYLGRPTLSDKRSRLGAHGHALEAGHSDDVHRRLGIGAEAGDKLNLACGVEAVGCECGCRGREQFLAQVDFDSLGSKRLVEGYHECGAAGFSAVDVDVYHIIISGFGCYGRNLEVCLGRCRGGGFDIECHLAGCYVDGAGLVGGYGNGVCRRHVLGAVGLHIVLESLRIIESEHCIGRGSRQCHLGGLAVGDAYCLASGKGRFFKAFVGRVAVESLYGVLADRKSLLSVEVCQLVPCFLERAVFLCDAER